MVSIRGATTIQNDSIEEIMNSTRHLLEEIIKQNSLKLNKVISIFFTCTNDITAAYPAPAARLLGLTNASLMCMQEMYVEGSIGMCIRVCVFYNEDIEQAVVKNIYLNGAVILRPDLNS
ncbi:MAG: chorismate mutase [Bacillota bacterium]